MYSERGEGCGFLSVQVNENCGNSLLDCKLGSLLQFNIKFWNNPSTFTKKLTMNHLNNSNRQDKACWCYFFAAFEEKFFNVFFILKLIIHLHTNRSVCKKWTVQKILSSKRHLNCS